MHLNSTTLLALREMDAHRFQQLVDYMGSRNRAIATALMVCHAGKDTEGLWQFVSAMREELISTNILLGFAVCLHGPEFIQPPYVLKALTRAMAREALHDFETIRAIVENAGDPSNSLLPRYVGDWWGNFDPRSSKKIRQSPCDIISFWEHQQKTLPSFKQPPTVPLEFNVGAMTESELRMGWTVANDLLSTVDVQVERSLTSISDLMASVVQNQALLKDLKILEECLIEAEADELGGSK